jgi:hypothetical protein
MGGWLGKLIGGAVGLPLDGQKQAHELEDGPALLRQAYLHPQSHLAFHLAWLRALEVVGPGISAADLVSTWLRHIAHTACEYGHGQANFRREIAPPLSGIFDNPFCESIGAVERAELWGLLAPADPELAARLARQDAALDHASAGVEAAIFMAALVSAAFVEPDLGRLFEIALRFIPEKGRSARAVRDVTRWHGELGNWRRTREMLLRAYASEDVRDSVIALGFVALSLLDGGGDLVRSVTTAGRCGWSTICNCSAAGAVMGVILGGTAVPPEWRGAADAGVSAGWGLVGLPSTTSLASLVTRTFELGELIMRSESAGRVELAADPSASLSGALPIPETASFLRSLGVGSYVTYHERGDLRIHVDYDERATIGYETPRRLTITLTNLGTRSMDLRARISAPPGFVATTNSDRVTLPEDSTVSFSAVISAPRERAQVALVNPCTLFVTVEGGAEVAAPISLVGEAIWYASGPYGDFDQPHPPENPAILSGEAVLGGEGAGEPSEAAFGWRRLSVAEPAVSLLGDLPGDRGTYYLATDYLLPRPRSARLRVSCNDGIHAWCNGQETWHQHEHRPADPRTSADEFPLDLREGWNRVVIKLAQCSPRRFLSVTLKDQAGQHLIEAANTAPRPR